MCLICVELIKQNMTLLEAERAAGEIALFSDDEHAKELLDAIKELDVEKLDELIEEEV